MTIQLPNLQELIDIATTEIRGRTDKITDFSEGSIIDAHIGGSGAVGQELAYQLALIISAFFINTATGKDLDDRLRDYNIFRKDAVAASGTITLTRLTSNNIRAINAGSTFKCADGTEFYNPNNIVFNIGTTVVTVSVIAKIMGTSGNILANTLTTIVPTPSETIQITHPSLSNGIDGETDEQLRLRFYLELSNMARGTTPALIVGALKHTGVSNAAVQKVHSGYNNLYIDSGTGTPSPELIQEVQVDIDSNWRSAGEQVKVLAAQTQDIDIHVNIYIASGYNSSDIIITITESLQYFLQQKNMGDPVYKAELIKVIMSVNGVINANLITPSTDIIGQASTIMRAGVIDIVVT